MATAANTQRVYKMSFAGVYPHYIQKAEKKGRTKKELDEVICWQTGYTPAALAKQIERYDCRRQSRGFRGFARI